MTGAGGEGGGRGMGGGGKGRRDIGDGKEEEMGNWFKCMRSV